MSTASFESEHEDWQLLGWLGIWSFACLVVTVNIISAGSLNRLSDETHFVLGFALAGLSATWIAAGTWVVLINLPLQADSAKQRWRPRVAVAAIGLIELAILALSTPNNSLLLAQALLMLVVGMAGPIIAWQWTHQRIHRTKTVVTNQRNIRQMMSVTLTIAIIAAILNLYTRWVGISNAAATVIVSNAFVWLFLLRVLLGRWWGLVLLTIPILLVQCISVSAMVALKGQAAERELNQHFGMIGGFYSFSLLFLTLMRSSDHRWLGRNWMGHRGRTPDKDPAFSSEKKFKEHDERQESEHPNGHGG